VSPLAAARLVLITYLALLIVWAGTRRAALARFAMTAPLVRIPERPGGSRPPGSIRSAAGTLLAFVVNILTLALIVTAGFRGDVAARLECLRIPLPAWLQIAGAGLFVLESLWGLWVLLAHPGYTPLFIGPKGSLRLARKGPYSLVRHPRYAAEAALHVILFAFTGLWIPLLGLLTWPALRGQCQAEEAFLRQIAPTEYEDYCRLTGRFLPKLGGRE
jgi:protein-S-isoprenylcysteine O-methyltransferase Ste14